jgi:hypothetical protein
MHFAILYALVRIKFLGQSSFFFFEETGRIPIPRVGGRPRNVADEILDYMIFERYSQPESEFHCRRRQRLMKEDLDTVLRFGPLVVKGMESKPLIVEEEMQFAVLLE